MALATSGSKILVGECSLRGPGRLGRKYPWLRTLPSRHAEHDVLEKVNQLQLDSKKVTIWSVSFKDDVMRNAKPCRSCARLMHQMGIRWCVYSEDNRLVKQSVSSLVDEAIDSRGASIPKIWENVALVKASLTTPRFELFVRNEDTFRHIERREKTIEGRLWAGNIRKRTPGEIIYIAHASESRLLVQIVTIRRYSSFGHMLSKINVKRLMPTVNTKDEALARYYHLYPKEKRKGKSVVALTLRVIDLPS